MGMALPLDPLQSKSHRNLISCKGGKGELAAKKRHRWGRYGLPYLANEGNAAPILGCRCHIWVKPAGEQPTASLLQPHARPPSVP